MSGIFSPPHLMLVLLIHFLGFNSPLINMSYETTSSPVTTQSTTSSANQTLPINTPPADSPNTTSQQQPPTELYVYAFHMGEWLKKLTFLNSTVTMHCSKKPTNSRKTKKRPSGTYDVTLTDENLWYLGEPGNPGPGFVVELHAKHSCTDSAKLSVNLQSCFEDYIVNSTPTGKR